MHTASHTSSSALGRAKPRRRVTAVLTGAVLALGLVAAPAAAHTDQPHSHALLLHVELDEITFHYDRCVDLANARALRKNHAHHAGIHTGNAGAALQAAGHLVVPYTCAELEEFFAE